MVPYRSTSRTSSTYTSSDGMAPSSLTSGTSRTSRTSVTSWMDEGTARPDEKDVQQDRGTEYETEELLIDMSDEWSPLAQPWTATPVSGTREPSPAEKLKILLRQMDAEIRDTTPVPRSSEEHERSVSGSSAGPSRSSWREGRRRAQIEPGDMEQDDREDVEQEDSPPTPPRRFASRNAQSPPARIPTRAAVLRASTSRSPEPTHSPTPLEAFIARPSTSSLSLDRSTSSSSSRKGKERARFTEPAPPDASLRISRDKAARHNTPPRNASDANTSGSRRLPSTVTPSRPRTASGRTPRRWSVELAPDGDEFAQHAYDLEARGDVELDLEEESGDPPWSEESADERPNQSFEREERTLRASPAATSARRDRSLRADERDTSLPALPQPSGTDTEEEEDHSISSRRAGMFRSPKTSRVINRFASLPLSQEIDSSGNSDPSYQDTTAASIGVTPRNSTSVSLGATPHPPGRWSTPSKPKPLSNLSPRPDGAEAEGRVHRIKLSPARSNRQDPDSSLLAKIGLRSPQKQPPTPSRTLAQAQDAIRQASAASSAARIRVEATQRQWLDALATAQRMGDEAVLVAKRGWGWGNWAWWVGVELLLVWGVFRVTLDYAQSTAFLAALDPFSPMLSPTRNFALAIPLPSAVSAFVIPRRGSANLFDLLERAGMWSRLEGWVLEGAGNGSGLTLVGGVPQ